MNCCNLDFVIDFEEIDFKIGMCYTIISGDKYLGEYTVIPKMISQYLYTQDKVMSKDVTVTEIPVNKTENISGGYTVLIGG